MKFFSIKSIINLGIVILILTPYAAKSQERPNVLFLTSDDLNFDSIGAYGAKVKNTTPNIDKLSEEGMLFQHAYVQAPNCCPSRNVFHTGNYSHNSGVEGFFSVDFPQATLPEALRNNGYFTGIIQKVVDSAPTNNSKKYWDYVASFENINSRTANKYKVAFEELLQEAKTSNKPFYASVNVQDPHLPFYRGEDTKDGFDKNPPSLIYHQDDIPIHPVLPQYDNFKEEMTDYYNTVRRGDDCIGDILKVLEDAGMMSNTLIVYISDHGMAFPFVKSNLYPQSVKTPWIVVWPNEVKAGEIDTKHMISAIDMMPTILEATNTEVPGPLAGSSLLGVLKGEVEEDREYVFVEHNEGPTAEPRPMRAVHSKDFVYIFNAWGTGDYLATMECRWYRSYATYITLSKEHDEIKERVDFLNYRTVEELYDVKNDPYSKHNLINDPEYAEVLEDLRTRMENWMRTTNDFALEGYLVKDDTTKLKAFMEERIEISQERATRLEWKRNIKNENRPEGKLTELGASNLVEFSSEEEEDEEQEDTDNEGNDESIEENTTVMSSLKGQQEGVVFYPNPIKNGEKIKLNINDVVDVRIIDQQGRVVFDKKSITSSIVINGLSFGVYFVHILKSDKTIHISELIVSK
ncbi:sulfatase-like hydrolase/transferase [Flammeovirga kamogawensis]|uniref:Sulfatase-like hydrolase/transferase n=1 Tax=Flammeovirga kamogawensis TaxID=373891 RepID=A0ABX8H1X5_9BACT|nr:sulfatase-like hydrolase/transferase [Flammeovirga kamogawensis]MBB6462632.1 N-sulfoglucosamine sulfohydrolase [Flammeovirga kamogawensis]QWG09623.1 sulfatase-like hydrolase/transferase [Flammeovirga kamogawensis]TRX65137.1 sulfatase-like hydrolase/transferase [Flammeovirga kamogawensis]